MATTGKRRASFFTAGELEILMSAYKEFEHVFKLKCNTAAAAKQREKTWEKIAARVNACSHGEKRSWQQIKMKYKNSVQKANRKKADDGKTGGGPAPPPLKEEKQELDLNQDLASPVAEGVHEESSSSIKFSEGAIFLVKLPHDTTGLITDGEHGEPLCAAFTEGDEEKPTEGVAGQQQESPSTSSAQIDTLPVKEIYRIHLLKKIQKMDKEMQYLDRQIRKADLEIEALELNLEEIKKTK